MKKDHKAFNDDVDQYGAYVYTRNTTLSSTLSSERTSKSILNITSFEGKRVLDIGCGDGIYTQELAQTNAALVVGIDPVENGITSAREKYGDTANLQFECDDLYTMAVPDEKYDIVVLRGVLHHLPDLSKGIARACLFGKKIIILEPNGYNPVMKIIEKTSKYHIEHEEQSFRPKLLRNKFIENGGKIVKDEYVNLVALFCPNWLARICKFFEPLVESIPLVKHIACGQYCFVVEMTQSKTKN